MTAQAPYESLTPDEAAQRLRLIGNECRARCKSKGVDCGTCARSDAAIEMAIAALPERAPVSAGGDGMLPDALIPRAKEWYSFCERAPHAHKITITGELAEAIVCDRCRHACRGAWCGG